MNNIAKYNFKTCAVSVIELVLLFSILSYVTAPTTETFEWNSINPLSFIEGFIFTLGFGLGVPVWLSVIILVGLLFFVFMAFLWVARKIIK